MKSILSFAFAVLLASAAFAQPIAVPPPTKITGDINIAFTARTNPESGVVNRYQLNLNINDSVLFHGTIDHLPFISNTFGSNQKAKLTFAIDSDVINPRNISQTKNVGKISGVVPIDEKNGYQWDSGNVEINVFGMGAAPGFTSKFKGISLGKPPVVKGLLAKTREAVSFSNSKGTVVVKNYDKMEFQGLILAAGPVAIYPETSVVGSMLYDYDRNAWYFQSLTVNYSLNGQRCSDIITGNIRWVESPTYKSNGKGSYVFDVRVNEPPASESGAFSGPATEESFFSVDTKIPSLTGTMDYTDTNPSAGVSASAIKVNLVGTAITKQQVMYLGKLILMASTVPFNDN